MPAHEEATLPLSSSPLPWPLPLQSPLQSPLPLPTPSPLLLPLPIAVAVSHCRCGRHRPLLPPSLLRCRQPLPLPLPLPLPSAIAVSLTIDHPSCHLHWPSLSPWPLAISESCCLGVARIVFNQLKQRMLTLFYFVWTVGGTLIKSRMTDQVSGGNGQHQCWAASSKQ